MITHARDPMRRHPLTLGPHAPFLEIQRLLVVARISGAPSVNELDQVRDDVIDPGEILRAV